MSGTLLDRLFGRRPSPLEPRDPVERLRSELPLLPLPPGATAELTLPSQDVSPMGAEPGLSVAQEAALMDMIDRALAFGTGGLSVGARGAGAAARAARGRPAAPQVRSPLGSDRPLFPPHRALQDVPPVEQRPLPRPETRRGASPRIRRLVGDPAVERQMMETVGRVEPLARSWYNMEPLRQAFIDLMGQAEGERRFRLFTDMIAASSPRSDFPTNVRAASYYYGRALRGEPIPDRPPSPYGHMAQKHHVRLARDVAGGGFDLMTNPKPPSFAENLRGNQLPATIDAHAIRYPAMLSRDPVFLETRYQATRGAPVERPQEMFRSGQVTLEQALERPAWWVNQPRVANEYAPLERWYQDMAARMGMTPAQFQAGAWVGGARTTGLGSPADVSALEMLDARLGRAARLRGESRADVLRRLIREGVPLLSVSPLALATALEAAKEDRNDGAPRRP